MPITPLEATSRQQGGPNSLSYADSSPDEVMQFRHGSPHQLNQMGPSPDQLKRSRDKVEIALTREHLTPKEFAGLYQVKLQLDDQIDRAGQVQAMPQQGGGLLSGLMRQPGGPPAMPGGPGPPAQMPGQPMGRRAPAILPLSSYGQPMQPGRGAGSPGADLLNRLAGTPGAGGLLRGLM